MKIVIRVRDKARMSMSVHTDMNVEYAIRRSHRYSVFYSLVDNQKYSILWTKTIDMDMALDNIVPEDLAWLHTAEGPDDSWDSSAWLITCIPDNLKAFLIRKRPLLEPLSPSLSLMVDWISERGKVADVDIEKNT